MSMGGAGDRGGDPAGLGVPEAALILGKLDSKLDSLSDRLGQLRNRNHSGRGARHIDPRQNWFSAVVDQFEDDLR